jgi:hypothetical protein
MPEGKVALNMYGGDTVKWEHKGKLYCLHIQRDENPMNPRKDWGEPATIMACFHRRYNLGDEIEDKEPEDFWRRLVRETVSESEILEAAQSGKLPGIRLAQNSENKELVDIYEVCQWRTALGSGDVKECLEYEGLSKHVVAQYLLDDLTIGHCMTLMEPYAEWLPLWLYDHSGITMSCGHRSGQCADVWDSSCVGWIVAMKEVAMRELRDYVLDEAGNRVKIEFKHEGQPSTWSYKTMPLTDETWRARAVEAMREDVKVYDQYLTGDVYGYTLYSADPADGNDEPDWQEEDSCWGFFGSDVIENGIEDSVGCGLREAVEAKDVEKGTAQAHTVTYYTF